MGGFDRGGGGGGGEGDGNNQKCTGEGRCGSVAGVDKRRLAWSCAEESEGEKKRGERGGVGQLFEAEVVRQRRGGSGSVPREGLERKRKRGPRAHRGTAWRRGDGRQRPGRGARRWRGQPNRGGEKGLTGGPRPQCRAAASADRRARAAQCRAVRIQIEFKNSLNRFKFAQTLTNRKGVFPTQKIRNKIWMERY
jgi:hypothetical protein